MGMSECNDLCLIDFAAAQERQYSRLVKQMKPDLAEYQEQKEKLSVLLNFFFTTTINRPLKFCFDCFDTASKAY
jgi:regulator of sirC expression with transglutaminase-like and TPR domain